MLLCGYSTVKQMQGNMKSLQLLYVRSKPGDVSRLILTQKSPIIFRLGDKLKAARLDGGLDLHPTEAAGDLLWESFLFKDPIDPTGLRLILKGISALRSVQKAASWPSMSQLDSCCEPCTVDRASPGFQDSHVMQTENKTTTQNLDRWYGAFVDPDTLLKNKKKETGNISPDTASCSNKRAASEMEDDDEFGPSKRSFTLSSSCYTDEK
ncbi:hypothetical protein PAMP_024524 [Pampus punctatissimus]